MPQRDERVRLAAAVGQFELPNGLVVLARDTSHDVADKLSEVVRRKRQREKACRIFVDRLLSALHQHFVEIGGEHLEGQLPRPEFVAQGYDFVPRLPWLLRHIGSSSR